MELHIFFHNPLSTTLDPALAAELAEIKQLLSNIMSDLTKLQAAVAAEDTVVDSAIALIKGLAAEVAALPPDQTAIDALAADITARQASLAAAVTANTPAPAPAPPAAA